MIGGFVRYAISVINIGTDVVQNVIVNENFDPNFVLSTGYVQDASRMGSFNSITKQWTIPSIQPNQTAVLYIE